MHTCDLCGIQYEMLPKCVHCGQYFCQDCATIKFPARFCKECSRVIENKIK